MIKFNKFNFSYSDKLPVYEDLNLELTLGKVYGVFGKNGVGKSTLLKNITGLNSPTSGSLMVRGEVPEERKPSFLSNIFMIPENVYVPPIKQINFIRIYGALYPKFSFGLLCEYLDKLDVPEKKKLNELSYGQKKKFFIAFALACDTEVVIMDEPTNGLDIPSKILFRNLIDSTISKDKIFIISTHQVKDLDNILDHVLIVDRRKLVLDVSLEEISNKISFNFYNEERIVGENIILSDKVMEGYAVMEKNIRNEKTSINLEQLFNAVILKPNVINSVFNTTINYE